MKRYLIAFDGLRFHEGALHYAIALSKAANAHLAGVFMDDFARRSYGMREVAQLEAAAIEQQVKALDEKDNSRRGESVRCFVAACEESQLSFSVHRNENTALQNVLHESIYADLLIIGQSETLTRFTEKPPTRFIREMLNEVQCPVVLVPQNFRPVERLILLYDGEPSSVYAVRMFSYLFEGLKHLPTEVVTVKPEEMHRLPDERLIRDFTQRHYPLANEVLLQGNPEIVIPSYINELTALPLVVLGAYQRSRFSRAFKPSKADHLMEKTEALLAIAHHKP